MAQFADGVRVAVTGASESGVFRWTEAEAALRRRLRAGGGEGADASRPTGMIGDLHGTPEYRAHLIAVLTARAVRPRPEPTASGRGRAPAAARRRVLSIGRSGLPGDLC